MSKVFVVDTNKRPLNPVHPGRARKLLTQGKAAVWRLKPFTLILKAALPDVPVLPLRIKLDPGSRTSGVAIGNDATGEVVAAAEVEHKGQEVKAKMDARRSQRRSRRNRKTRYRAPRFDNRRRKEGALPPSLESRVANLVTVVGRYSRLIPITGISMELVRFD